MKYIPCIILLFFVTSCLDLTYEDEAKYWEWADEKAPLNDEELSLIDSLSTLGFRTDIERHFINRNSDTYRVRLQCDTLLVTKENYNQLNDLKDSIISKLYRNIIADSVLFVTERIDFSFDLQEYVRDGQNMNLHKSGLSSDEFFPIDHFLIKDLEVQYGFKVKKSKNNTFIRVKV